MIARSAAHQIKYYVLAVSRGFSHGLARHRTFGATSTTSETVKLTLIMELREHTGNLHQYRR